MLLLSAVDTFDAVKSTHLTLWSFIGGHTTEALKVQLTVCEAWGALKAVRAAGRIAADGA
jgi:hypothetical protein